MDDAGEPSAKRSRRAPVSSRPSNRPARPSGRGASAVPSGWAAASQAARTGASPSPASAPSQSAKAPARTSQKGAGSGAAPASFSRLVAARSRPAGWCGEVDAEADDHRVALPLEQDAGELGAVDEQVVGPFDPTGGRVAGRSPRGARTAATSARVGAAGSSACRRTRVEAWRLPGGETQALPCRPLPPVWRSARSHRPSAAPSRARGGEVVIGRAGFGDGADHRPCLVGPTLPRDRDLRVDADRRAVVGAVPAGRAGTVKRSMAPGWKTRAMLEPP